MRDGLYEERSRPLINLIVSCNYDIVRILEHYQPATTADKLVEKLYRMGKSWEPAATAHNKIIIRNKWTEHELTQLYAQISTCGEDFDVIGLRIGRSTKIVREYVENFSVSDGKLIIALNQAKQHYPLIGLVMQKGLEAMTNQQAVQQQQLAVLQAEQRAQITTQQQQQNDALHKQQQLHTETLQSFSTEMGKALTNVPAPVVVSPLKPIVVHKATPLRRLLSVSTPLTPSRTTKRELENSDELYQTPKKKHCQGRNTPYSTGPAFDPTPNINVFSPVPNYRVHKTKRHRRKSVSRARMSDL